MKNEMEVKYKEPQRALLKNWNLMLLWTGKSVSIVGDTFFDLAVIWVIYSQSHSTLQSAHANYDTNRRGDWEIH